jgi:hypothetical protein
MLLLMLTAWKHKSQVPVLKHFWGMCCFLCGLHLVKSSKISIPLFANFGVLDKTTTLSQPVVVHHPTTCFPSLKLIWLIVKCLALLNSRQHDPHCG